MSLKARQNFSYSAPLKEKAGYSSTIRIGDSVSVSGTMATTPEGVVEAESDVYHQTEIILQKIEQVLTRVDTKLSKVYRVWTYVTDISQAKEYMKVYSKYFKIIKPVVTMAEVSALARLVHLVEVKAEAIVRSYLVHKQ